MRNSLKETAVSYSAVDHLLHHSGTKYLLLLLTECSVPKKVKHGTHALSSLVLDEIISEGGPLDHCLSHWSSNRPSTVSYHRLPLDRDDKQMMTRVGTCWLPQVRLVRRETILFRSSVSIGDNNNFLAQDVGGKSFVRRTTVSKSGYINLLDALDAELDKSSKR